ncbi:MAG: helix-turn-helix domain-containing protein [Actinomycetota bacterium]|nr:helix-turn-helix domain-containing protein [Actinomycetota bacterium]
MSDQPTKWRPAEHYVHGHGEVVVVPARVAAWLTRYAGLERLRAEVRGADAEVDSVLVALALAAFAWRSSATGSGLASAPEVAAPCAWMSTTQAARLLGITDRGVRLAIAAERLPAQWVDGRWRVAREDVEHYRAARAA